MRIISGTCRGRKLVQIQGRDIRPTSDRVREALFNIIGPAIRGTRVLDLFAGTGAFGLEAVSRGAKQAVFVDAAASSCQVIKKNIELCRMDIQTQVVRHDLILAPLPELCGPFDFVFMDPPYYKEYPGAVLGQPGFCSLLAPGSIVIVEHASKETLTIPGNSLDKYLQKKYSKTTLTFLREAATD